MEKPRVKKLPYASLQRISNSVLKKRRIMSSIDYLPYPLQRVGKKKVIFGSKRQPLRNDGRPNIIKTLNFKRSLASWKYISPIKKLRPMDKFVSLVDERSLLSMRSHCY